MTRSKVTGVVSLAVVLGGCSSGVTIDRLSEVLVGEFSSAEQAALDPDNYFDIRLHSAPIWTSRDDGPWLYVEQASAEALDRPYRQRVYRLSTLGDRFISDVYTMPEPLLYAGWYQTPERFDEALSPDELDLRDGCSIVMTWDGDRDAFVGSTVGNDCASSLRGASYATSEVLLTLDLLETWDRGYDASGSQVWGADQGPYRFIRRDR
ncbi:MAG: chromophore lyase CpcT/CpeT [Planctomycetota bacterium]